MRGPGGTVIQLRHGVYATPVVADFWTTFQWVRGLRRTHDERLVAIYVRVPDGTPVYVGRYDEPHVQVSAAASAEFIRARPNGVEVVIPRRIASKEVLAVREIPQLVGWTEVPELERRFNCVCPACLGRGDRRFTRRIRAAYAAGLAAARRASTDRAVVDALARLEMPLERAARRLDPTKLTRYV